MLVDAFSCVRVLYNIYGPVLPVHTVFLEALAGDTRMTDQTG